MITKQTIREVRNIVRMRAPLQPETLEDKEVRYLATFLSSWFYYEKQSAYMHPDSIEMLDLAANLHEGFWDFPPLEGLTFEHFSEMLQTSRSLAALDLEHDLLASRQPGWFVTISSLK